MDLEFNQQASLKDVEKENWWKKHKKSVTISSIVGIAIVGIVAVSLQSNDDGTVENITRQSNGPLLTASHYDPTLDVFNAAQDMSNGDLMHCSKVVGDEQFLNGHPFCASGLECFYFNQDAPTLEERIESTTCLDCSDTPRECHHSWDLKDRMEFYKLCGTRCTFSNNGKVVYSERCVDDAQCKEPWLQCRFSGANYPGSNDASEKNCLCNVEAFQNKCSEWDDATLLKAMVACKGLQCPGKSLPTLPSTSNPAKIGERCAVEQGDEFMTDEKLHLCEEGLKCITLPKDRYLFSRSPASICVDCNVVLEGTICNNFDEFLHMAFYKMCGTEFQTNFPCPQTSSIGECLIESDCPDWKTCVNGKCECSKTKYLSNCKEYSDDQLFHSKSCRDEGDNLFPACPNTSQDYALETQKCHVEQGDIYDTEYNYPACASDLLCVESQVKKYDPTLSYQNTSCVDCSELIHKTLKTPNGGPVCREEGDAGKYFRYDSLQACDKTCTVVKFPRRAPAFYYPVETCIIHEHCEPWEQCLPFEFYSLSCQCSFRYFQEQCNTWDDATLQKAKTSCGMDCFAPNEIPNEAVIGESCSIDVGDAYNKAGRPQCASGLSCAEGNKKENGLYNTECVDCDNIPMYCSPEFSAGITRVCGMSCDSILGEPRPFCDATSDCSVLNDYTLCPEDDRPVTLYFEQYCTCDLEKYNAKCSTMSAEELAKAETIFDCPPCGGMHIRAKRGESCSVEGVEDELYDMYGPCKDGYQCIVTKPMPSEDNKRHSFCENCDMYTCSIYKYIAASHRAYYDTCGRWCDDTYEDACDTNLDCEDTVSVCVQDRVNKCESCWMPSFYVLCPDLTIAERTEWLEKCDVPVELLDPSTLECGYTDTVAPTDAPTVETDSPTIPSQPPSPTKEPTIPSQPPSPTKEPTIPSQPPSPTKEPTIQTKSPTPEGYAKRDERCKKEDGDDFDKLGYKKCGSGLICVTTDCYSQCVSCNPTMWNQDCQFWSGQFLEAAHNACGVYSCDPSSRANLDERCAVEVYDKFSLQGHHMCGNGLSCVVQADGYYSQCVDCQENWVYDCSYWSKDFLSAAESLCNRSCEDSVYTYEMNSCTTDADCGGNAKRCLSVDNYSQCILCNSEYFKDMCRVWGEKSKSAAEMICGIAC